ncbi:hypothetical protein [Microbulbifer sp. JMSA008]|uniref:hypothetical protein n=1 Tax=Microbulbifer sp. JMSA008 TaxID=3243373 RepID=UPI0040399DC1
MRAIPFFCTVFLIASCSIPRAKSPEFNSSDRFGIFIDSPNALCHVHVGFTVFQNVEAVYDLEYSLNELFYEGYTQSFKEKDVYLKRIDFSKLSPVDRGDLLVSSEKSSTAQKLNPKYHDLVSDIIKNSDLDYLMFLVYNGPSSQEVREKIGKGYNNIYCPVNYYTGRAVDDPPKITTTAFVTIDTKNYDFAGQVYLPFPNNVRVIEAQNIKSISPVELNSMKEGVVEYSKAVADRYLSNVVP